MRGLLNFLLLSTMPLTALAQQRPAITGVAFFRGYAADRDASAKFYDGDLGFTRVKVKDLDRYAVNGSQWFEMAPLPSPAPASRMAAVGFTTRDAKALETYLKAKSVPVVDEIKHGAFSVRDPEGNLVYFVQAGSMQKTIGAVSPRASAHRVIHVGFVVKSREAEDKFWKEILGFKPYWSGGMKEDRTDWASLQVPDGSDWLEYMLNVSPTASLKSAGVMDHFSMGVTSMQTAIDQLKKNGCTNPACSKSQMGRDGKVQMNLYDPDLTRIEYMEFNPSGEVCCSPITGKAPTETEEK
jgi:catechol 2,3-dioxygenase-like lactoylglutathione lyase family enzyme